ncbi:hypothetical protein LTR17_004199 [Elasticomyces elasticus]|nr:hypothetical protein LTR17_004199 [Elasticomyces elasticus]
MECIDHEDHLRKPTSTHPTHDATTSLIAPSSAHVESPACNGDRYRYVRDQVLHIVHILEALLLEAPSVESLYDLLKGVELGPSNAKLLCDAMVHVFGKAYDVAKIYESAIIDGPDVGLMLKLDPYGFWCDEEDTPRLQQFAVVGMGTRLQALERDVATTRWAYPHDECSVGQAAGWFEQCLEESQLLCARQFHFCLLLGAERSRVPDQAVGKPLIKAARALAAHLLDPQEPEDTEEPDEGVDSATRPSAHANFYMMICDTWQDLVWNTEDDDDEVDEDEDEDKDAPDDAVTRVYKAARQQPWVEWVDLVCAFDGLDIFEMLKTDTNDSNLDQEWEGGAEWWRLRVGWPLALRLTKSFPGDAMGALRVWLHLAAEHVWYCFLSKPTWGFTRAAHDFLGMHEVYVRIPNADRRPTPRWIRAADGQFNNFKVVRGSWPQVVEEGERWTIMGSDRLAVRGLK